MVEHREGYSNIIIKRTFVVLRDLNPGWLDSMSVLCPLRHQYGFQKQAVGVIGIFAESCSCGIIHLL